MTLRERIAGFFFWVGRLIAGPVPDSSHVHRTFKPIDADKTWRPTVLTCQAADDERHTLFYDNARLSGVVEELTRDKTELKRLIDGAFRLTFASGPALTDLVGQLVYTGPNIATKTVVWENPDFILTVAPFDETLTVSGKETLVQDLTVHARGGRLGEYAQDQLIARIARIVKSKGSGGHDPVQGDIVVGADAS